MVNWKVCEGKVAVAYSRYYSGINLERKIMEFSVRLSSVTV
jgi:hypothetical protein